MEAVVGIWFLQALVSAIFGIVVGSGRNAPVLGGLLGFFLGPVGVIVACLIDVRPQCPNCREHVQVGAAVCVHCHESLVWNDDGNPALRQAETETKRNPQPDIWPGAFDPPPADAHDPK
jgi:hypothetical protein